MYLITSQKAYIHTIRNSYGIDNKTVVEVYVWFTEYRSTSLKKHAEDFII